MTREIRPGYMRFEAEIPLVPGEFTFTIRPLDAAQAQPPEAEPLPPNSAPPEVDAA